MARRKGKERLLTEQIEELGRLEKGAGTLGKQLDTIYSDLANNLQRVQQSTEKQKSSFQDQVDIGKKLLGNAKNIFAVDLQHEDLTEKIVDAKKRGSKAELATLQNLQKNVNVQKIDFSGH